MHGLFFSFTLYTILWTWFRRTGFDPIQRKMKPVSKSSGAPTHLSHAIPACASWLSNSHFPARRMAFNPRVGRRTFSMPELRIHELAAKLTGWCMQLYKYPAGVELSRILHKFVPYQIYPIIIYSDIMRLSWKLISTHIQHSTVMMVWETKMLYFYPKVYLPSENCC